VSSQEEIPQVRAAQKISHLAVRFLATLGRSEHSALNYATVSRSFCQTGLGMGVGQLFICPRRALVLRTNDAFMEILCRACGGVAHLPLSLPVDGWMVVLAIAHVLCAFISGWMDG
jgi:hypothetical protein